MTFPKDFRKFSSLLCIGVEALLFERSFLFYVADLNVIATIIVESSFWCTGCMSVDRMVTDLTGLIFF